MVILIILIVLVSFLVLIAKSNYEHGLQVGSTLVAERQQALDVALAKVADLEYSLKKVVHQKKSSEVRTGLIVEQMAPFLEGFPYSPSNACFLGRPIDFIVFNEDSIAFVEVKSGEAKLSLTQRRIRDLIKAGKVTFEVYKIKGE